MRDSVNEDYDNRSVIKQIYDIRKRTGDATANSEEALRKANEAIAATQGYDTQIAANTSAIAGNTDAINAMGERVTENSKQIGHVKDDITMLNTDIVDINATDEQQTNDITAVKSRLSSTENESIDSITVSLDAVKNLNLQILRASGEVQDMPEVQMPFVKDARTISGTTNRSFKIILDLWNGSQIVTNDMLIPEGGGTSVTVTGITLKDGTQSGTIVASIVLSDGTEIDSNELPLNVDTYTKEHIDANFVNTHGTQSVNGAKTFLVGPSVPDVPQDELTSQKVAPVKQIAEAFETDRARITALENAGGGEAIPIKNIADMWTNASKIKVGSRLIGDNILQSGSPNKVLDKFLITFDKVSLSASQVFVNGCSMSGQFGESISIGCSFKITPDIMEINMKIFGTSGISSGMINGNSDTIHFDGVFLLP